MRPVINGGFGRDVLLGGPGNDGLSGDFRRRPWACVPKRVGQVARIRPWGPLDGSGSLHVWL